MATPAKEKVRRTSNEFRIGRVKGYRRGLVWYLCYFENGTRRRPSVGKDLSAAKQLAAQINGQLEAGAPSALSFEPISIPELRLRWLNHHEHVLRSSLASINRYRAATEHLLRFVETVQTAKLASHFSFHHAEKFACYLRTIDVSPNGHANSKRRPLRDKGLKYILETCRALFTFARKRRHLSPYAENPFVAMQLDRIPVDDAKPIRLMSDEQERLFLESCDEWQLPIFATLLLTGLRPGELAHLLLPEDLDLDNYSLIVRNRSELGWQTKTRRERVIPLLPCLAELLRQHLAGRAAGPAFRRRRFASEKPPLDRLTPKELFIEFSDRIQTKETTVGRRLGRIEKAKLARGIWSDAGGLKTDRIRTEFIRLMRKVNFQEATAPKLLRHMFATALQDANVDPLIRNELMGHSPARSMDGSGPLGMTGHYTHTRPETKRQQLTAALIGRPAATVVKKHITRSHYTKGSTA